MTQVLAGAGIDNAHQEAEWLVEAASGEVDRALELARRRVAGEPLQYLTGIAGFRRLLLAVGPGVLIPRPETEGVAGKAIELLPQSGTLIDLGTGSGAIALAVADERPDAAVLATEISAEALRWAERNRDELGLSVRLILGDLFEGVPEELRGKIDVVVSNLPYIGERERQELPLDVVDHEPGVAIFGGHDGLELLRRMIPEATDWLAPDGWLVLEISPWQRDEMTRILTHTGFLDVVVEIDLAGRERVAIGRRPG